MSETNGANGLPHEDWTPEQKKAILAEMKKKFTVEDLLEYVNDDSPLVPFEQVIEEMKAIAREAASRKPEAK